MPCGGWSLTVCSGTGAVISFCQAVYANLDKSAVTDADTIAAADSAAIGHIPFLQVSPRY